MKTVFHIWDEHNLNRDESSFRNLLDKYSIGVCFVSIAEPPTDSDLVLKSSKKMKNQLPIVVKDIPLTCKPGSNAFVMRIPSMHASINIDAAAVPIIRKQILSVLEGQFERSNSIAFIFDSACRQHVLAIEFTFLCSHIPIENVVEVVVSKNEINGEFLFSERSYNVGDLLRFRACGISDNVDRDNEQTEINNLLSTILDRCQDRILSPEVSIFVSRCAAAMRKDYRFRLLDVTAKRKLGLYSNSSSSKCGRQEVCSSSASEIEESREGKKPCTESSTIGVKEVDNVGGIAVFEYFSGIGGMRLALPAFIRGVPITSITAFDCSSVANQLYSANFERGSQHPIKSVLRNCMIENLKLSDVDNKADLWTMSPPCQPFTTTKGANRLDERDNRCKGLFHLMALLRAMKLGPRWILVENVKGFVNSAMLNAWQDTLRSCGYIWRQYVLSPESTVGVPNHRARYYMIAEHSMSAFASRLLPQPFGVKQGAEPETTQFVVGQESLYSSTTPFLSSVEDFESAALTSDATAAGRAYVKQIESEDAQGESDIDEAPEEWERAVPITESVGNESHLLHFIRCSSDRIFTHLPRSLSEKYMGSWKCIGQFLQHVRELWGLIPNTAVVSVEIPGADEKRLLSAATIENPEDPLRALYLTRHLLSQPWMPARLSCVGDYDSRTYCFTKGYSRLVDKSSGSCFFENAREPLQDSTAALDRSSLVQYAGKIRFFHPRELFALFGFPDDFQIPPTVTLRQQYACIGNSVNIFTVREVMNCLFCTDINLDD